MIGYIVAEIVLAIFTAGVFSEVKWVTKICDLLGEAGEILFEIINGMRRAIGKEERLVKYSEDFERLAKIQKAEAVLQKAFINGYTKESVIAEVKRLKPLGEVLEPSKYLSKEYIANHLSKFEEEGAAFVFTEEDIGNPIYKAFNPKKYVTLTSDMKEIVEQYQLSKNTDILEKALGYPEGSLKGKKLYVLSIDEPKVKMPNGSEGGVNELWTPGGKTSGGYNEAVLDNASIPHGNKIENILGAKPIMDFK